MEETEVMGAFSNLKMLFDHKLNLAPQAKLPATVVMIPNVIVADASGYIVLV